jgi:NADPH:quinone reductase-like Zn-dependent oxidoreductase
MIAPTLPRTMTVWRQDVYGPADVVSPVAVDVPRPAAGEVLLRVDAVSLNSGDVHLLRGTPALLRLFLGLPRPRVRGRGMDVAGTVVALGDGVDDLRVGDAVVGAGEETLADFTVVKASRLVPRPGDVDAAVAATLPIAGSTAVIALDACRVTAGHRVLVVGAGGGVGTLTVQLAADRGAEVWATVGARAEETLQRLGADRTFDYRTTELAALPPASFDAIIDIAGEPPLRTLAALLRPGGTVALVGGGGEKPLGPIPRMLRTLFVRGRFRPIAAITKPDVTADLLALAAVGRLTPEIERTFPLAEARAALASADAGHTVGKVVVVADHLGA